MPEHRAAAPSSAPRAAGGAASLFAASLRGRCPRCGEGRLFAGLLDVQAECERCGLDLRAHDAGDGPAVAGIFILGTLAMIGAFVVEFRFEPPLWVHAVLWTALLVPGSVLVMRVAKAALVTLQWRHRREGS